MMSPGTTHLAEVSNVSGWDKATAIGTSAAAVATLLAVGAALWIAWRDRRLAAKAARRDHLTDLLLRLQGLLIDSVGDPAALQPSTLRIRGLLAALPLDLVQALPAVRLTYAADGFQAPTTTQDMKHLHRDHPGITGADIMSPEFCARQVGELIGRVNRA